MNDGTVTYGDAEAGDLFFIALGEHVFSVMHVVRLAVGDHHHHFGSSLATTCALIKSPLTDQSRTQQRLKVKVNARWFSATFIFKEIVNLFGSLLYFMSLWTRVANRRELAGTPRI